MKELHRRMQQYKKERKLDPLYEHLGGTSAKRLAYYGKARSDGKSVSRVVKLTVAEKSDYFFTADSGPGEESKTGLIVPRFGKNPEQHVAVILTWRQLNEILFTTVAHYNAWLSAKYMAEWRERHAPRLRGNQPKQASYPETQQPPADSSRQALRPPSNASAQASRPTADQGPAPAASGFGSAYGSVYGKNNGKSGADDNEFF